MKVSLNKSESSVPLLALMLNWNAITGTIELLGRIPALEFLSAFSNITVVFSIIFLMLTFLLTITNTENIKKYIIILIWLVLFLLSIFLTPAIRSMAPRAFIYYVNNIFCIAVLLQSVSDLASLVEKLKKYIPINLLYSAMLWIVGINGEVYSMSFSYGTMVSMLLCLVLVLMKKEKRIWYFLSFMFILGTNFKYGSRGSFICCILAVLLYYFLSATNKKIKYLCLFIFVATIISIFWGTILEALLQVFPKSRNLIILLQGNVFYGSGREEIYAKLLGEFYHNPFAIRGLYSDRVLLSTSLSDIDIMWGSYSHNVFIELLYQWGVWSIPIIIVAGAFMIRVFLQAKKETESVKTVLILAYSFSIGQLLISSSYLITPSFGLLLGILLWSNRNKNRRNVIAIEWLAET